MNTQYLSQNFKACDFESHPSTAEFSQWLKETSNFYDWLSKKLSTDEGQSLPAICNSVRKTISTLEQSFKNITKTKLTVTSVEGINVYDYLEMKDPVKPDFHHNYSEELFKSFLILEYSLLISRDSIIYSGQLKLAAYKFLFSNFSVCHTTFENKKEWAFTIEEVNNIIDSVLMLDIIELLEGDFIKKIKAQLGFEHALNVALRKKENMEAFEPTVKYLGKKPFNAQCLIDLWKGPSEQEITQAGKIQLIIEAYNCSKSTAINYMKKFGLWEGRNENKKYSIMDLEKAIEFWKRRYENIEKEREEWRAEILSLREQIILLKEQINQQNKQ